VGSRNSSLQETNNAPATTIDKSIFFILFFIN
jgi:hypothetical protein